MHTEDQKSRAYSDACVTQRWSVEDLQYTSEGALAWACFNAGYKLAADATPAPLADVELAELARLELAAAPAPWFVVPDSDDFGNSYLLTPQADTPNGDAGNPNDFASFSFLDDAELTTKLRNALPGLLARLTAAEARLARWVAVGEFAPTKGRPEKIARHIGGVDGYWSICWAHYDGSQWLHDHDKHVLDVAYILVDAAAAVLPTYAPAETVKGGQPHA